ncbi:MAG: bifunctional metallophosphatase/5'-nucleotidase [Armatimonadetes bacterium]|nr:bifunctional metallophosphatase/5'-nucleotidase [Akkermansiaceae bacterium]
MSAHLSRRHFLATSSAWAAASSLGIAQSSDHRTISIIHTTDLHGHILPLINYAGKGDVGGFARCATQIRRWKKENPNSLLVDIGDLYQGTAASFNNQGRLFVDFLANLEYDAWVLGNHDFDWGPEVLGKNLEAAKTSILTANLTLDSKTPGNLPGSLGKIIPWKMCEIGGFKIALIGLITPGLPYWLTPETLGGILPTDTTAALKKSIAQAKSAHADAILVLGHFGHRERDDFANPLNQTLRHAPGADVYIAGHTHIHIPSMEVENTLFTQVGCFGEFCGKIDLTFDLNSRKLISKAAITELMDARYELDPGVINLAQPALKASAGQLARVLTTLTAPIPQSSLTGFLCECFAAALKRNQTPVDAVFHGTFGIKEIPVGPVTVADAWKIVPYENMLVTATLTPTQLLEIVAEDRDNHSGRTLWPFEVISDEMKKPVRILKDGTDLPADKTITVAFNSYDSQSGGQSLMRLREIIQLPSSNRRSIDINTRDALIESLLKL